MDNIELTEPRLRYRESPLLLKNEPKQFRDVSDKVERRFALRWPLVAQRSEISTMMAVSYIAINATTAPHSFCAIKVTVEPLAHPESGWFGDNRDALARDPPVSESGLQQTAFISTAGSYISASDKRAHFGLGSRKNSADRDHWRVEP